VLVAGVALLLRLRHPG